MANPSPNPLDLELRLGLPEELRFLVAKYPRASWPEHFHLADLGELLLHFHGSFRSESRQLIAAAGKFREGEVTAARLEAFVQPRITRLLTHLEGHHQIEDRSVFPVLVAAEPRLQRGFDLLETDHVTIHRRMDEMAAAKQALTAAVAGGDADAMKRAGEALAASVEGFLKPLERHLDDEEELVIPLTFERPGVMG